jgi:hypothetical protein
MASEFDTRELKAKLKFDIEKGSETKAKKSIDELARATERAAKEAQAAKKRFAEMREQAEKLQQVGTQLSLAGAAIGAPLLLAARNYVNTIGTGEQVSRRWLSTTEQMEKSTLRIGRVAAEQLLPVMEKIADVAEKAADYAEKNPEAVGNVLKVAAALVVSGQAISLLAGTRKLFAGIGEVGAGVAGKVAGGAAAGSLGTFGGIAAVGGAYQLGITKLISDQYKKIPFIANIINKEAEFLTNAAEKLFGPEMAAKVARWTGLVKETGEALDETTTFTDAQMKAFLSYKEAESKATADYNKQRAQLISSFERSEASAEKTFLQNRDKQMRDFYRSEQRTEADYYRQRAQMARDFGIEIQRSEEDHQRELARMQADHNQTVEELLDNQDAFGLVREMQSYERQRREADEDYSVEMRRRSEDYARQVAEQAQSFAIQRQQRMEDFQLQLKDNQEQYLEERQLAKKEHQESLRELKTQYDEERRARRTALIASLTEELDLKRRFNAVWFAELQRLIQLANQNTTAVQGSRASGGYVTDGIYRMHDDEFVLNKNTTRAVERMAGGNLNQQAVLRALSGGRGQMVIYDNRRFDGRITAADRADIRRSTDVQLLEAFDGAV